MRFDAILSLCFVGYIPWTTLAQQQRSPEAPQKQRQQDQRQQQQRSNNAAALQSQDVRAIATTLAPAGLESRYRRAPSAKSANADLSSRLEARSLQDWEVEDIVLLATVDGTIHARDRKTGAPRWALEADKPLVETIYHEQNTSIDGGSAIQDFLWIVEPSQDGALYAYSPGQHMHKLGLTVKQLMDVSPYASDSPPVIYEGAKRTTLYSVDVASGKILPGAADAKCRQKNALEALDDDECGVVGTLNLGRTEYVITVKSKVTRQPVCTINYFEWGPNVRDRDLYDQYSTTKDNRYIYSLHDGRVLGVDHLSTTLDDMSAAKPMYRQKFESPVARVFDVVRPTRSPSKEADFVILPQPAVPISPVAEIEDRVFVNCTEEGSWYALSEQLYPLATKGALPAPSSPQQPWYLNEPMVTGSASDDFKTSIVGVHYLSLAGSSGGEVPMIGGPPPQIAIEEPKDEVVIGTGEVFHDSVTSGTSTVFKVFVTLALLAALLAGVSKYANLLFQISPSNLVLEQKKPGLLDFAAADTVAEVVAEAIAEIAPLPRSEDIPKMVRFQEPEKEPQEQDVPPESGDAGLGALTVSQSVEDGGVPSSPGDEGKRKKAHRGKRGGKRFAEKRDRPDITDSIVEGVKQMGQDVAVKAEDISGKEQTHDEEPDKEERSKRLGDLTIHTGNVLGCGSGGTFVFEGEWEGEPVAVKRMLQQHFELAMQEISLLKKKGDHPNVIKYFCKQEDQHFLYIALELCQASLHDLFKDGRNYDLPSEKHAILIEQISRDPRKVLKQLAEGLKHLHTSRIVHRDIKPQNMLVAYPKEHKLHDVPQLVISDFGLCKTLPENVSTLVGTTGNAGTVGWKAPELIFQPRELVNNSSASRDSMNGESSQPGVSGVKRAVDIFSLGCVFFYILTKGQHPFDDEEGWMQLRERNIKTNRANLSALEVYGPDVVDLVSWMLAHEPEDRPTAAQVLAHPFFWTAEERLEFLSLASDRFDLEPRDGTSPGLAELESHAASIIPYTTTKGFACSAAPPVIHGRATSNSDGSVAAPSLPEPNFLALLDRKFIDTLGRQRKYVGSRVADLLRALRNKHHHWDDMPDDVKERVGEIPEGYLRYWETRFPALVVGVWGSLRALEWDKERRFQRYFGTKEGSVL